MKKLLLLLTLTFTITSSAQYAILSAVDVKDGMEEQYLALEAFFGPIHDLAIEKGMLNSQAVFKVINTSFHVFIMADDGATFECIKHLGRMKAQYRKIPIV